MLPKRPSQINLTTLLSCSDISMALHSGKKKSLISIRNYKNPTGYIINASSCSQLHLSSLPASHLILFYKAKFSSKLSAIFSQWECKILIFSYISKSPHWIFILFGALFWALGRYIICLSMANLISLNFRIPSISKTFKAVVCYSPIPCFHKKEYCLIFTCDCGTLMVWQPHGNSFHLNTMPRRSWLS